MKHNFRLPYWAKDGDSIEDIKESLLKGLDCWERDSREDRNYLMWAMLQLIKKLEEYEGE